MEKVVMEGFIYGDLKRLVNESDVFNVFMANDFRKLGSNIRGFKARVTIEKIEDDVDDDDLIFKH